MNSFYDSYDEPQLSNMMVTDGLREMLDESDIIDMYDEEDFDDTEYRDSQDNSARLAERHYC